MAKSKKPSLELSGLKGAAGNNHHPVEVIANQRVGIPPSRIGKVAIQGYFDKGLRTQLRQLALAEERSSEALLEEAIKDLLTKYGVAV